MRNAIIITIGLFLALVMIIMWRLTVFDANSLPHSRVITFTHHEDILEGTLTLPDSVSNPPVVVLIHGDGAQDRWSQGGYLPLVNDLLAKGIAVYSWDKPGVGESRGNWLAQTMRDRSDEATVALKTLKKQPELLQSRFGFLGFSQAGWVVPQAAMQSHADFAAIVGAPLTGAIRAVIFWKHGFAKPDVPSLRLRRQSMKTDVILICVTHRTRSPSPVRAAATGTISSVATRLPMHGRILRKCRCP
ncbi:alpha/beta hydrolase family protein [Cronobacter turicensis]|uniref:alpha/beta hydrolase family protein n=1 Tax=Cronobacter turicensis TaxID=413502 RepID=UPI000CFC21A3|nr:alpha/beta fold hydrolase [Cronobacter turicensis]